MTPEQIVERERRRALPVALATFGAIALFVAAIAVGSGAEANADTDVKSLATFPDDRETLLAAAILQGTSLVLLIFPLAYLFQAANARSAQMKPALIGITIAGPLFLGAGTVLQWVAFDQAASEFATPGGGLGIPVGEYAEDLIRDRAAFDASQGFSFAGLLGFVIGLVYTSLHAMRVGLLTRFWGSLGMALGVSVIFLSLVPALIFFIPLGLLIAGLSPGGRRPAAWEAGVAVPWPKPGEEPAETEEAGEEEPAAEPADAAVQPSAGPSGPRRKRKRRRR